jgi:exosortase B
MNAASRTAPHAMGHAGEPGVQPAGRRLQGAAGVDPFSLFALLAGLASLYGPTYFDLLFGAWSSYAQGHEALVAGACAWLLWRQRHALAALSGPRAPRAAAGLLGLGLLMYVFGRSQQFLRIELLSQVAVLAALLLHFRGWGALRLAWFPLAFLLFVVPLPYSVVIAITGPMKAAVSAITVAALQLLDYPVGRSGVVITVGQYQLLVAEACAGLQTMFALEAFGLLYTNLMNYKTWQRGTLMAVLVVPVAFLANVVRTAVLVLVTYHFGDEVGQGFVHGFAGLLLFAVALLFIHALDRVLGRVLPARWAH